MHCDHLIPFSSDMARSHGLEQAITFAVLQQFQQFRPNQKGWLTISDQEFIEQLPFWNIETIHRALNQLRVQGLIEIHQAGNTIKPNCLYRVIPSRKQQGLPIVNNIPASTQSPSQGRQQNSNQGFGRASTITEQWHPDPHVIEQLTRLGIPQEFIQEAIPEFITYWLESGRSATSWGSKFQKQVTKLWREYEAKVANDKIPAPITRDWHPNEQALGILRKDGIDEQFIQDSVAEFLLYWIERGSAEVTWNNKFVSHIRHQWQKFCSTIEHSTNPTRIPKNWQPSTECYEIARLAQIDITFAKDQVKEFVLYWSETNQTSTSWNTKFVQHLKWTWAKRHQLETIGQSVNHEKTTGNHQSRNTANQSFSQRIQDTSWADDL